VGGEENVRARTCSSNNNLPVQCGRRRAGRRATPPCLRTDRLPAERGGTISNWRVISDQNFATLISANVPREGTRWSGINSGKWVNPAYEDLFARSQSALAEQTRMELQFSMVKIVMDELPHLPAYYNPSGVAVRKGLEGVGVGNPINRSNAQDIHLWDMK
jgi:ABC-type transport system substrate-binding protein